MDATVLVDCHSRFERDTAPLIVEELAKLNVGWFEEPVQPTSDPEDLAAIARWAPIPVAGGESGYGVEFFNGLLDTEAVSVVMPDIKHCGGAVEAVTIGRSTDAKGKGFSMHSPSGPISLLASGHATAAVPNSMPLEHAVYEADWRADLLAPRERVEDGHLYLTSSPGLGAEINWDLVRRLGRVWD
jgi:galactonate dehydratase